MNRDTVTSSMYMPILKAKAGEADAMSRLSEGTRRLITPLFDIPSPSVYGKKTLDEQISHASKTIARACGKVPIAYVDTYDIPLNSVCRGGVHPVVAAHELCRSAGISTIPVTGFDRDEAHLHAVRRVVDAGTLGACIRIDEQDIEEPEELAGLVLERCLDLGLPTTSFDVLIDLRSLLARDRTTLQSLALETIQALGRDAKYRTITLSGSSFPRDVSAVQRDGYGFIERAEYSIWKLVSLACRQAIAVRFGDYGVVHPDFVDLPAVPNANAKIRYTIGNHWYVVRGHQLSDPPGFGQYPLLASEVRDSRYFCGASFSYGDSYIARCADGVASTGNLRTWVGVDMNHHVHFVVDEIRAYVEANRLPIPGVAESGVRT